MVEYLAPVLGHELTTRKELLRAEPGHPRADEDYYKIQIGELMRLNQPILAGNWKRFTFLYTTGEYFRNAKTLTDLSIKACERRALWKSLRERAAALGDYRGSEERDDDLPLETISALLGILEKDLHTGE
jgi:hypothetical protein